MRNFQKAAVVMAMLGSVSFLGAGVGHAADGDKVKLHNDQKQACAQNDAQTGLIQLDDVNVSVGLLGWSQQDNSEKESLACSQGFGKH
ncbi:hypothetical protein [Streptomyces swartbergensis]|uniref:Secreted protein n=1 Tax=Streptomyces swartbergensis TaxID=487165 RepID=A0A243RK49_9ACTN|nr:hypothetical protein [Streptomyces swartbergensis]OUC95190.1 hypothetical protein CA983_33845 [Streptomyces swartbergensis]